MKSTVRQIAIVVTTLATLIVNGLANALPINGLTTGEVSDQFETYFVPAGYVFSIWGLIYIGLIAYTIYQALPAQRENPRLARVGWWVVLANIANAAWLFLWHHERFPLTLVLMFILLFALLLIYEGLRAGTADISPVERWTVRVPFSIYLGWVSVATIANVSDVLYFVGWGQFGLSAEAWMVIMLGVVVALAWVMSLRRADLAFLAVFLWALAGIGVRFPQSGVVTIAIWGAFGLVVLAFIRSSWMTAAPLKPSQA